MSDCSPPIMRIVESRSVIGISLHCIPMDLNLASLDLLLAGSAAWMNGLAAGRAKRTRSTFLIFRADFHFSRMLYFQQTRGVEEE